MPLTLAAIRTGHDPVGKLPEAAFHTQLEQQLLCPKCSATYNLLCDYAQAVGRHFEAESARPIALLKKAVFMGHFNGHRVVHFESAGVVVTTPGLVEPVVKAKVAGEPRRAEQARRIQ